LDETQIDRVGAFTYEPVTGAPANELDGAVPDEIKQERYGRLMEKAQAISVDRLSRRVGRTIDVLIDDVAPEDNRALGRSQWDAPEIDGQVFLDDAKNIKPGDMVKVTINDSDEYDLFGTPAEAAYQADKDA